MQLDTQQSSDFVLESPSLLSKISQDSEILVADSLDRKEMETALVKLFSKGSNLLLDNDSSQPFDLIFSSKMVPQPPSDILQRHDLVLLSVNESFQLIHISTDTSNDEVKEEAVYSVSQLQQVKLLAQTKSVELLQENTNQPAKFTL